MSDYSQYEISPLKLWSPLQRHLAACGQGKASPQQWIGTIRNLQKKGVSAVEIEWSGILRWLGEVPESEKVFNELVTFPPVLKGKPPSPAPAKQLLPVVHLDELLDFLEEEPPCNLVLQRHISKEYMPEVRYIEQPPPATPLPPIVVNGRREIKRLHYRDRTFGICIWLHREFDTGLFDPLRYWSLSVARGSKKLAAHAVGRRFAKRQDAFAYGRELVGRMARRLATRGFVGQTQAVNKFTRYLLPGGDNYTEWLITAPNLFDRYWGEHFDLPNIVAHVRTTERATSQGGRLLVLEEIQSDWNQELREAIRRAQQQPLTAGETEDEWDDDHKLPPDNPYLNHWLDAALRMMLLLAAQRSLSGIAWLPGKLHAERFPWANSEGLATFYDRIVPAAAEKLGKSWGVQIGTTQFAAVSQNYRAMALKMTGGAHKWCVMNLKTGEPEDQIFDNMNAADKYRLSLDAPSLESISALFISKEMRADILKNGLPCLGAVGKR